MYQEKYLVLVSGAVNSNKFYRMKPEGGELRVEYGRVGMSPRRAVYPLHKFDSKYREKIRKGYVDHSHIFLGEPEPVFDEEYKAISNIGIRRFIGKLLLAATC